MDNYGTEETVPLGVCPIKHKNTKSYLIEDNTLDDNKSY